MKLNYKLIAILVFTSAHVWAQGHAQVTPFTPQAVSPTANCMIPKIEGERVPFPLKNANSKFALVEDETYLLNGTVVTMEGKYFLKVDFNSQPWLATEKVLNFPYFLIDDDGTQTLGAFAQSGVLVQVAIVARRPNGEGNTKQGDAVVNVDLILPPAPITQ